PRALDAKVLASMAAYSWPGNVRELRNLVERWLILGNLPDAVFGNRMAINTADNTAGEVSLEAIEKQHILKILAESSGNKTEASRRLGVSRKPLERKCAEWGV